MGRRWNTTCVDCGGQVAYADSIYQADAFLGETRPSRCANCDEMMRRELRVVPISHVRFFQAEQSRLITNIGPSPLGRVRCKRSVHRSVFQQPTVDPSEYGEKFGVKDAELVELYQLLCGRNVPVVIAVAETGSGKSTYLPYRLLQTIEDSGVAVDEFTRFGQIVITQPRIAPTTGISKFVSEGIHGQQRGIGWDIGYRFSGNRACDWRNRMTYVTDGTLINWLINGDLAKIGLVFIDEAHERSNNIDVILGLLARALPRYPHLKVVIASATIDEAMFKNFFDQHLPDQQRCEIVSMSGKTHDGAGYVRFFRDQIKLPVQTPAHSNNGHAAGDLEPLDYQPDVPKTFEQAVPNYLAEQILYVLKHAFRVDGYNGVAPDGGPVLKGDIVGFLHGEGAINEAVEILRSMIAQYPSMKLVDVFPLYSKVDDDTQRRAIDEKQDARRTRIIISSNMAETSLTIDGIVHVVDSGIIKMTRWDPVARRSSLDAVTHSKAGCTQRWGRAGRKEPGQVWCLYTQAQFSCDQLFRPDSIPEIERSELAPIVLNAKGGGANRMTDGGFPWIGSPDPKELQRAEQMLKRAGALDDDGDLTELGLMMRHGGENSIEACLLEAADRFGCAIEMATVLPILSGGIDRIWLSDPTWDEATEEQARNANDDLRQSCSDDLELALKVHAHWRRVQDDDEAMKLIAASSPAWREYWKPSLAGKELGTISNADRQEIAKRLRNVQNPTELRALQSDPLFKRVPMKESFRRWEQKLRLTASLCWAVTAGVDAAALTEAEKQTEALIDELGASKKENERRDINFKSIRRLRTVFAWVLRGNAFVLQNDDPVARPNYVPLTLGDNESDWQYRVGKRSAAFQHPPQALVTLGTPRLNNIGDMKVAYLSLVIAVDRDVLAEVGELDETDLGFYLAEQQLKPVNQFENQELATRILMDQVYPRQTKARCRVLEQCDGGWLVEVLSPVRLNESVVPARVPRKKGLLRIRRKRPGSDDSPKLDYMIRRGQEGVTTAVSAPDDNVEWASDQEQVTDPQRPVNSVFRINESDRLIEQLKNRRFRGKLINVGGRAVGQGETVDAFVAGFCHGDRVENTALLLTTRSAAERYKDIKGRYQVGDTVMVSLRPEMRESQARIIALENTTGAECVMSREDIAMYDQDFVIQGAESLTSLCVEIAALDDERKLARVSALPVLDKTLQWLGRNTDQANVQCSATVVMVDDPRQYWLRIQPAPSRDGGPTAKWLQGTMIMGRLDRRPNLGGDAAPSIFQAGQNIDVEIPGLPAKAFVSSHRIKSISSEELSGLRAKGIDVQQESERVQLSINGRFSLSSYQELIEAEVSRELSHCLWTLFKRSNTPNVVYKRKDLDSLFPSGTIVAGIPISIDSERALLRLDQGVVGRVERHEVSWFTDKPRMRDTFPRDEEIKLRVRSTSYEDQEVSLSLKRVSKDPWKKLIPKKFKEKSWVPGRIDGWSPNNTVFVELLPGFKAIMHQEDVALDAPDDLSEILTIGASVKVKVKRLDVARRRATVAMFDIWEHVKKSYRPGQTLKGVVRGMNNSFAYVELESRVEGSLHVSCISSLVGRRITRPNEAVSEGHQLTVQIIELTQDENINLDVIANLTTGAKRRSPTKYECKVEFPKRFKAGSVHSGCVTEIREGFGAFVELCPGLQGLIHIRNVDSNRFVEDIRDYYQEGQAVRVRVKQFDDSQGHRPKIDLLPA